MTGSLLATPLPTSRCPTTRARVTLGDLRGGKVIVYFYPAAMTPGCTTQACDFSDSLESLKADGYTVLGISPDTACEARDVPRQGGAHRHPAVRRRPRGDERVGRLRREEAVRQDRRGRHPQSPSSSTRRAPSPTPGTTSRRPATSPSSAATSESSEDTMSAIQPAADAHGCRRTRCAAHRLDPCPRGRDHGPARPPGQDDRRAHLPGQPEDDPQPAGRGGQGALRRRRDHPRGRPSRRADRGSRRAGRRRRRLADLPPPAPQLTAPTDRVATRSADSSAASRSGALVAPRRPATPPRQRGLTVRRQMRLPGREPLAR